MKISRPAVKEAKRFLLDSVGCALAAVNNEDMAAMYRFIEKLGGVPEATLIGTGHQDQRGQRGADEQLAGARAGL